MQWAKLLWPKQQNLMLNICTLGILFGYVLLILFRDKMKQLNTAMQNVDSQYKIKEKVNSSMQSVGEVIVLTAETAKVLAQQAAEQPYIAQGVNAVVNVGHSIAKVVEDEAAAVSAGIEAKRRATHLAAPAPSPAEPASPSPSQPTSAPVPAPPAVPVTEVPK